MNDKWFYVDCLGGTPRLSGDSRNGLKLTIIGKLCVREGGWPVHEWDNRDIVVVVNERGSLDFREGFLSALFSECERRDLLGIFSYQTGMNSSHDENGYIGNLIEINESSPCRMLWMWESIKQSTASGFRVDWRFRLVGNGIAESDDDMHCYSHKDVDFSVPGVLGVCDYSYWPSSGCVCKEE